MIKYSFQYMDKTYTIIKTHNKWEIFDNRTRVKNQKGLVRKILEEKYKDYTIGTSDTINTHMAIRRLHEYESKGNSNKKLLVVENKSVAKPKNGSRTVNLWIDSYKTFNDDTKTIFEKTAYLAYYLSGWRMANSLKNIRLFKLIELVEWLHSNQQLSTSKKYLKIRNWFKNQSDNQIKINNNGKGLLETKFLLGTTGEIVGLDTRVKKYIKNHYKYIKFDEKWYEKYNENELNIFFKSIQKISLTNTEKEKLIKLQQEQGVDNLNVNEKEKDYFFWYNSDSEK